VKSYPQIIDRILDVVRQSKTFCIVGHIRPDGDCVGSQLGLALACKTKAKSGLLERGSVPQKYKFLNSDGLFQKPKRGLRFDCVIATDCASFERLGKAGSVHQPPKNPHQH
jgi:bifunctional oligoribonuclease and PAP phosphatase NrnA